MRYAHISIAFLFALTGLLLPLGPAHAGGGGGGGLCAGFTSGEELVMLDNCFSGVAHFAMSGSTLLVKNDGALPHTYTAVDGSFDTGILQPGEIAEIRLGEDGISRVYCTLHGSAHGAGMAGVLVVGEAPPGAIGSASSSDASLTVRKTSGHNEISFGDAQEVVGEIRGAARTTILTVIGVGVAIGALIVVSNRRSAVSLVEQDIGEEAASTQFGD